METPSPYTISNGRRHQSCDGKPLAETDCLACMLEETDHQAKHFGDAMRLLMADVERLKRDLESLK